MKKTNPRSTSFHYHNILIETHPQVYEPAEDTFLLLDSIKSVPPQTVLEVGTGCGIIALLCASRGNPVVCTDVNPHAVQLARHNIQQNKQFLKGPIEVRQGDLLSPLQKNEKFDIIIFNPPYLPTATKEKIHGWYNIATDGGNDGLAITKRFLHGCKPHLKKNGRVYFIVSSLSPKATLEACLKKEKLASEIVATQRFEGEDLEVYCAVPVD